MSISETAHQNHEALFPNRPSTGNDKATLLSVVTQLLPYVGYPRTLNAIRCLNEVVPEPIA
jgi:alkylhydroperoxidase/carboxymuconolactone decarboxylase family protein YurZ